MKLRYYVLLAVVALVFFVIALFPAKLAWQLMPESMRGALPLQVTQIGGTLWDGHLAGDVRSGLVSGTHAVSWDLRPLSLLWGTLSVDIHGEHAGYKVEGNLHAGLLSDKGVDDLTGEIDAELANAMLSQLGASASGVLFISELSLGFDDAEDGGFKITEADGTLDWNGGPITYSDQGYPRTIEMPALSGVLEQREDGLRVGVVEKASNGALGELTLEGPIGGVVVLKRVMKIIGMDNPTDEDAVLVQLQQPLFL